MTRASGGNLARTPGLHPTLYEKCRGIFNDHRESGPRFNVSSERRMKMILLHSYFIDIKLKGNSTIFNVNTLQFRSLGSITFI